jgi:hypothetical protein
MNHHIESRTDHQDNRMFHFEDGRLYFSRDAERKFFFALTIIMLLLGAGFKLGVW